PGAIHLERVGNVNRVAQDARNALGHGGLAVAGRAEQKQRRAGHDRRTNLVAQRVWHEQVRKGLTHALAGHQLAIDALGFDGRDVVRDRYRQWTAVQGAIERLERARRTFAGQHVGVACFADATLAAAFQLVVLTEVVDDRSDHGLEAEATRGGELRARDLRLGVHAAQDVLLDRAG